MGQEETSWGCFFFTKSWVFGGTGRTISFPPLDLAKQMANVRGGGEPSKESWGQSLEW